MSRLYYFPPQINAGIYNQPRESYDNVQLRAVPYFDDQEQHQQYLQTNNNGWLPYYHREVDGSSPSSTTTTPPSVSQNLLKNDDGHNSAMQMDVSPSTSGVGATMTTVMTPMVPHNMLMSNGGSRSGLLQQHSLPGRPLPPPQSQYNNITIKSEPLTSNNVQVKNEPADFGGKINNNSNNINCHNSTMKYEIDSPTTSPSGVSLDQKPNICAGCNCRIVDRYLLKADDKVWHEVCLRCHECGCQLTEKHKSLFLKNNKIYCRNDYTRLFVCSVCHNVIPPKDLIMRAGGNVYHLNCFACQECEHRFCVGDKFYFDFDNNKILCEYHYSERTYFAGLSNCNSPLYLAQLKRQFSYQMDDLDEMIPPVHR